MNAFVGSRAQLIFLRICIGTLEGVWARVVPLVCSGVVERGANMVRPISGVLPGYGVLLVAVLYQV